MYEIKAEPTEVGIIYYIFNYPSRYLIYSNRQLATKLLFLKGIKLEPYITIEISKELYDLLVEVCIV
jgi:hypothetical protein